MKNNWAANLIIYVILFALTWLLGAFAWWMACKGFNIPFSWEQYAGIVWVALIFRWFNNLSYSE